MESYVLSQEKNSEAKIHQDIIVESNKIGDLEVVETEKLNLKKEKAEPAEIENKIIPDAPEKTQAQNLPEDVQSTENPEKISAKKQRKPRGIKLSPEIEAKVDEKVNEMLGISKKEESKEENKENL